MDLYLIRHTRTNAQSGLCYGRLDLPLALTHADDCAAVVARLPTVEAVWSSPLVRCRTLAEIVAARNGVAPVIEERLREMAFGDWEGRSWDELDRAETERWTADYWNIAPPNGETYQALYERVAATLVEICARDVQSIAVVTHAGPIRAVLVNCLRMERQHYPELRLRYGGITLLRRDRDGWRLEYLNG